MIGTFIGVGFGHIVSLDALDHLLFLAALAACYRPRDWRHGLAVASAFTVGHSVTLALASLGLVSFPVALVEFLIPCTIVIASLEKARNGPVRVLDEISTRVPEHDLVYCDPPYTDSQSILYGGQAFSLHRLFRVIAECKDRGVRVALSIDGTKKSGSVECANEAPDDLFEREALVNCGRSMLRRFQREGETLEDEIVHDRLLLTY